MFPKGKGWFIWQIIYTEGGDNEAIAELAQHANMGHVLIKIADGIYKYNVSADIPGLVKALHDRDIEVWGWHYVYGKSPSQEGSVGAQLTKLYDLDGYVADVESHYKFPGNDVAASQFCDKLNSGLGEIPTAISSYRYPKYHLEIPWSVFLSKLTFNMPQVYWIQNNNPVYQLNRCIAEFATIEPVKPIVPSGAAFRQGTWEPTTSQIIDFLDEAKRLKLPAINFWEWRNCRAYLPEVFEVVAQYDWPTEEPTPPPELTDKEKLDLLWEDHPDLHPKASYMIHFPITFK